LSSWPPPIRFSHISDPSDDDRCDDRFRLDRLFFPLLNKRLPILFMFCAAAVIKTCSFTNFNLRKKPEVAERIGLVRYPSLKKDSRQTGMTTIGTEFAMKGFFPRRNL
jgi:hypothetical protein